MFIFVFMYAVLIDMDCYSDGGKCLQFNTLKDIQHKLGTLGQGRIVFVWYVPSTNIANNKAHAGVLETRIYLFSRHLITYGFDVKVDLFAAVNHTSEADWASWTDCKMSQADWIICVCSQSLYAMFHNASDPLEIHSLNTKATFLNKTLYNRLLHDTKSKIISVILQPEDDNLFFVPPTLRDPKNILRIFEDTPFDVKKIDGDLERLICRMAGIDRMALKVTEKTHQGFIKLPSKIPQR